MTLYLCEGKGNWYLKPENFIYATCICGLFLSKMYLQFIPVKNAFVNDAFVNDAFVNDISCGAVIVVVLGQRVCKMAAGRIDLVEVYGCISPFH